ncbi:hypothetical protein [Microbispora triticiradicis]|uniref:hypothetical protein n=1 Tax=Microbispora triticiradicis TaxID=2200763 RepID=UPI001FCE165A|nr:hypothetical protein [Microbispora triticiradicis]
MDVEELVAIDVHTHAEVSAGGHASLSAELFGASERYFKEHPRPTIPEMAAYYRERKMAAVVFTVDAEHATGHPRISNQEIAHGYLTLSPRPYLFRGCRLLRRLRGEGG